MKLACVIHRFGPDIAGGSEAHCRGVAEQLAVRHDVTVLTTCARDHITWRNEFPAGQSAVGAIRVRRFPVCRTRSLHRFADASEAAFDRRASTAAQEAWFRENGPDAPDLVAFLASRGDTYDWILFWSYRYAPTYFGLPAVADRAILVPTAEEDAAIELDVLGRFFRRPAGCLFLTPEEAALVGQRADGPLPPWRIIGSGLDPAPSSPATAGTPAVAPPFFLYLGRVDPNKGCAQMVRDYERWAARRTDPVPLVMAGPLNMPMPQHPFVRPLGYVSAAARDALVASASALLVPSPYESLSMVLLEAWNRGVPALVNGQCRVLKGQVQRAEGGLYYRTFPEFVRGLDWFLSHPNRGRQLGRQGRAYVDREYRWPHVIETIESLLASLAGRVDARAAE